MASTEAAAATFPVEAIAAMSDAELRQFIKEHRRPEGGYELPVDGWDKLSKDEQNRLAERLKAQERGLAHSPTACFRPLHHEDLSARLRQVSFVNSSSLRPNPQAIKPSEPPAPLFDPEVERARYEIGFYDELINDGGRPLYSIDLIKDVFKDPDKYADILRPWQESLTQICPERVFKRQLLRWQEFRKWQNDNRDGFSAYVERRKDMMRNMIQPNYLKEAAKRLAEIEADPSCLESAWNRMQSRKRQRSLYREDDCDGFRHYAEAVKRRLARHDFTRPFELDENPQKQDQLTTWIEFLNYEYWWLDKYMSDIKRLEPDDDKARQALVDMNIRRPHENKEFLHAMASSMEHAGQREEAKSIRNTLDYADAKRNTALQSMLIPWILEQIPLIEAEMNQPKANEAMSDGTSRWKRRLTTDAEHLGGRTPKKPKFDQSFHEEVNTYRAFDQLPDAPL